MQKRSVFLGVSIALLSLALTGCPERIRIGDISNDPGRYYDKEVTVAGRVVRSYGAVGAGVYEIDDEKGKVAVNVDPREGALGRLTLDEFQRMLKPSEAAPAAVRLQAQHIEAGQSYWRYGLLLMLAALVAESVVGRVRS